MSKKYSYVAAITGDTSGIVTALKDVEENTKRINARLSSIKEGLKWDNKSPELLAKQYQALDDQLNNTKTKLEALKRVEKEAAESHANGDMTKAQYAYYRQQIERTTESVKNLEIQLATSKSRLDAAKAAADQTAYATKGLASVLDDASAMAKAYDNELREIDASLKDGAGTDALKQKYNTLTQAIENTKTKLEALKSAEENMDKASKEGTVSIQEQKQYQLEITQTTNKLARYESQLKNTQAQLKNVENNTDKSSVKFKALGVVGSAAAHIIADAFRAAVSAISDLSKSITENAAAVRAENAQFEQTFGEYAEQAAESIQKVADSSGILNTRLNTAATGIYAFARGAGGSVQDSMSLMSTAVQAAADAAAYYDRSLENTTESLRSFLKGNFENDAALGVSCTEATRNAAAMELFGEKYKDLSEIQKQQTLLKMVTDAQELSGAMGQAAREADGWENVNGNLAESWRQLQAAIGDSALDSTVSIVGELTEELQNLTQTINDEGLEAAISQIGDTMSDLASIIMEQLPHATEVTIDLISALADGINENSEQMADSAAAIVTELVNGILKVAPTLSDAALNMVIALANAIGEQLPNLVPAAVEAVLTIAQGIIDNINSIIDAAGQLIIGLQKGIVNSIPELIEAVPQLVISLASAILDAVATLWVDLPMQMFEGVADGIKNYDWTEIADQWAENGAQALEDAVSRAAVRFMNVGIHLKNLLDAASPNNDHGSGDGHKLGGFGGGGRREAKSDNDAAVEETEGTLATLMDMHGEYYKQQGLAAQKNADEMRSIRDENIKDEVAGLDTKLKLHKITEEQYYADLEKYLNDHVDRGSEVWWEYYDKITDYRDKQAENDKKAEQDIIKGYWDEVTRQRDQGEIDDETEYKLKAQIVKKYCDENEKEWDSYYTWLYKYQKNKNDQIAKNEKEAWENNVKTLSDTLTGSYENLVKQKEKVKEDLANIDLTETVTDVNGKDVTVLTDLDAEYKKLDTYQKSLNRLKATGISDELLADIMSMDYADGSRQRMIDTILGLSAENRQRYYNDYAKVIAKQDEIAQASIQDGLDDLNEQTANAVDDIFGTMPESAYAEGAATAQSFIQGIIDAMGGTVDNQAAMSLFNLGTAAPSATSNKASGNETVAANTPITIILNDKEYISTTVGEMVNNSRLSGGSTFNL